MKALSYSLLKYLSLLLALIATVGFLFYGLPTKGNLIIIQIVLGISYVGFSVIEFTRQMDKRNLPVGRFFYFPLSFLSSKFIKLAAFSLAFVLLFISKTNLIFLAGLLLTLILTDILIFTLRIVKQVYYVSLFANYVLFSLEDERKVFASQVKIIEFRYNIFYLQLSTGKIYTIEVDRMQKEKQNDFTEKFVQWALNNKLEFTEEAKEKLAGNIAKAV